jgi:hypothetical protein
VSSSQQSWHASLVPQQEARDVLWLGHVDPPQQLQVHLRGRGFSLCAPEAGHARPAARLSALEASTTPLASTASLAGRRLAMVHPDPGAADAVAQALRAKGAEVVILSLNPASLDRALVLGPHAVLMESGDFYGACWELVRALWQHPRLCFTPLLLSQLEGRGLDDFSALDTLGLCRALDTLCTEHDRVLRCARAETEFSVDLSELGPARLLRVLVESGRSLRATFSGPEATIAVDLTEHVIVGASAEGAAACLGPYALALLLKQRSGSVQIRRVEHPAVTNIIAPLDTALDAADRATQTTPSSGTRSIEPAARSTEPPPAHSLVRLVPKAPENDQAARAPAPTAKPPVGVTSQRTLVGLQPSRMVASFPPPAAGSLELPPPVVKVQPLPPMPLPEPAPLSAPAPAPLLQLVVDNTQLPETFTSKGEFDEQATRPHLPAVPYARHHARLAAAGLLVLALTLVLALWPSSEPPAQATTPSAQPSARPVTVNAPHLPLAPANEASDDDSQGDNEPQSAAKAHARQASKLVSQGHSFRRAGLYGSARRRYDEALEVFPNYPRALAGLAQVSLAQGKNAEAIAYANRLRHERPHDAYYQKLVTDIQHKAGAHKE